MVMRWVTRDLLNGEFSDQECDSRLRAYRDHTREVGHQIPASLRSFAGEAVHGRHRTIHDAHLVARTDARPDFFSLEWICGDELNGYERLRIEHRKGVELLGPDADQLARWLDGRVTDFLYDEIDVHGNGDLEHRHILWPEGEFGIRFANAEVSSEPATMIDYHDAHDYD
jgi:hypothetical protein